MRKLLLDSMELKEHWLALQLLWRTLQVIPLHIFNWCILSYFIIDISLFSIHRYQLCTHTERAQCHSITFTVLHFGIWDFISYSVVLCYRRHAYICCGRRTRLHRTFVEWADSWAGLYARIVLAVCMCLCRHSWTTFYNRQTCLEHADQPRPPSHWLTHLPTWLT